MNDSTYMRFGKMISEMRMKLGLSQDEVAERLGLKKSTYGNYERGERKVPLPELIAMSKFYGFSLDEFINEEKKIQWVDQLSLAIKEEFDDVTFTQDEINQIIEYTKFILTKRD